MYDEDFEDIDYEGEWWLELQAEIKKAEKGDVNAMVAVGQIFSNDEDFMEAFKWYKLAAAKGHPTAQFNVGYYMISGWDIDEAPNKAGAKKWIMRAAKQGDKDAIEFLKDDDWSLEGMSVYTNMY